MPLTPYHNQCYEVDDEESINKNTLEGKPMIQIKSTALRMMVL